ncbi:hypothetical protein BT96DRAFT_926111, partial [Gymnopus androsaceus JB14]
ELRIRRAHVFSYFRALNLEAWFQVLLIKPPILSSGVSKVALKGGSEGCTKDGYRLWWKESSTTYNGD